jgi:hypothetical protein
VKGIWVLSVIAWFHQSSLTAYPWNRIVPCACIAMPLSLTDKLNYKLRSIWKLCLSVRKSDWELNDYPVVVHRNKSDSIPVGQQYIASILHWPIAGAGNTREEALVSLRKNFGIAKAKKFTERSPLPRPGAKVPIEFASQDRVKARAELADDFVRRVLDIDGAWISDESSLWDFHQQETNAALVAKIREVYGVDVSDIESGNLADILDRVAANQRST